MKNGGFLHLSVDKRDAATQPAPSLSTLSDPCKKKARKRESVVAPWVLVAFSCH